MTYRRLSLTGDLLRTYYRPAVMDHLHPSDSPTRRRWHLISGSVVCAIVYVIAVFVAHNYL
jgi:hypothetical protein